LVGWNQAGAIVWAQWRTLRNYIPRSNLAGLIFSIILAAFWYGTFLFVAGFAAVLFSNADEIDFIRSILPNGLLLCFLYWQLIPVLMASMGSSLDIKKLLVYPIPSGQLFTLEVLLRISTGVEMLLLLLGAGIGLLLNPSIRFWAPLSLGLFVAFNLLFSAGVRDLLVRLLARRKIREVVVFLFILAAALPQVLLMMGGEQKIKKFFSGEPSAFLPWTATARIAAGEGTWLSAGVLLAWTAIAYLFGRWQFQRGLTFDAGAAASQGAPSGRKASRMEWFYNLPNAVLPDPLANLIEKELRFLTRAPRFRLVFLMGFSFGLLIWAPMAFGRTGLQRHSLMSDNYLALVSVYALLLLSDALFWNCFGFDRSAAQVYFLVPIKMSTILLGKNLAALFFVFLEISAIALVCALLRLPITALQILEAAAVTLVVTLFLLSIGNLSSFYNPRSVNPVKSFRTAASGRTQAFLMLTFPVALAPIALAYLARYAFSTEWAFFGVLLFGAIVGAIVYSFSMDTAVKASEKRKEEIIAALSKGAGPIES
jgi:ABC-2 type transport system permease protein